MSMKAAVKLAQEILNVTRLTYPEVYAGKQIVSVVEDEKRSLWVGFIFDDGSTGGIVGLGVHEIKDALHSMR